LLFRDVGHAALNTSTAISAKDHATPSNSPSVPRPVQWLGNNAGSKKNSRGVLVEKLFKWVAAIFISAAFALLSVSAFQQWTPPAHVTNKVIAMLIALQQFMVGSLGNVLTGTVFAVCAVGILVAAWRHEESKPQPL
jgi:hypothetical protein